MRKQGKDEREEEKGKERWRERRNGEGGVWRRGKGMRK